MKEPGDLPDVAVELVKILLHLTDEYNIEGFVQLRLGAMVEVILFRDFHCLKKSHSEVSPTELFISCQFFINTTSRHSPSQSVVYVPSLPFASDHNSSRSIVIYHCVSRSVTIHSQS